MPPEKNTMGEVSGVGSVKIRDEAVLFHISHGRSSILQFELVENVMDVVLDCG